MIAYKGLNLLCAEWTYDLLQQRNHFVSGTDVSFMGIKIAL